MTIETRPQPDSVDRIETLEAHVAQLAAELQDLGVLLTAADAIDGVDPSDAPTTPRPMFPSVDDWVDQYFGVVFSRPIGGSIRWCRQWREHAEAVLRLEALWRSWETLRLDPNVGMATWLTNFLDPQLAALTGPQGTFGGCTADRHAEA